jgi:hypothetical protein
MKREFVELVKEAKLNCATVFVSNMFVGNTRERTLGLHERRRKDTVNESIFLIQFHHMSLMDSMVSPPGCGRSVTDF